MAEPQLARRRPPANSNGRAAAESDRREPSKESFLAAMSHELRTPLNAIIGFAEIMDAEVLGPVATPQYAVYVRDIVSSARHLLQIVEDVLEIARAQDGNLALNKHEVDVLALLAECHRAVDAERRRKRIRIVADAPDHLVIQVDPEKLKRVIVSLLSNSVKFSPAQSLVHVRVSLDEAGLVTIRVEDDGIGMDAEAIERAFEPFVQLDNRLSREFDGCGLGLPLARLLTEAHGGRIELDSVLGVGTSVTVTLPAYARAVSSRAASD